MAERGARPRGDEEGDSRRLPQHLQHRTSMDSSFASSSPATATGASADRRRRASMDDGSPSRPRSSTTSTRPRSLSESSLASSRNRERPQERRKEEKEGQPQRQGQQRHLSVPRALHVLLSRSLDALDGGNNNNHDRPADEEKIATAPESLTDESWDSSKDDELARLEAGERHNCNGNDSNNGGASGAEVSGGDNKRVSFADLDGSTSSRRSTRIPLSRIASSASTRRLQGQMSRHASQMQMVASDTSRRASMTAQKYYRKSVSVLDTDIGELIEEEGSRHRLQHYACCFVVTIASGALLYLMLKS